MADQASETMAADGTMPMEAEVGRLIRALEDRAHNLRQVATAVLILVVVVIVTGILLFSFARDLGGESIETDQAQQLRSARLTMSEAVAKADAAYGKAAEFADAIIAELRSSGCEDRTRAPDAGAVTLAFLTDLEIRRDRGLSKLAGLLADPKTSTPFFLSIMLPSRLDERGTAPLRSTENIVVTRATALRCATTLRSSAAAQSLVTVLENADGAKFDYETSKHILTAPIGLREHSTQAGVSTWHSLLDIIVARVSSIIIMIGVVLLLLPQSRFCLTLAGFYQGRADALRLCQITDFPADMFSAIATTMTPQASATPSPSQSEGISTLVNAFKGLPFVRK